jgi:hypothetical protein
MNFHQTIAGAVRIPPSRRAVHDLVVICHRIALAYLKGKVSSGSLSPARFAMCLEDVALDCIADLFHHNENGELNQIAGYYSQIGYEKLQEEELMSATRRLIFGKVNQDLYRQYAEIDPTLHKIIRIIKNHSSKSHSVKLMSRSGDSWVMFRDEGSSLPLMPPEILEPALLEAVQQSASLGGVIDAMGKIFRNQNTYVAGYPLVALAQIIRSVYSHLAGRTVEESHSGDSLSPAEIRQAVSLSAARIAAQKSEHYISKQSLPREVFEAYFKAIQDIWNSRYLLDGDPMEPFYNHLKVQLPGLTPEEYRQVHRTRLEYLAMLTHQDLLEGLRKEI